jgi:plasmid stability protein
MAVMVQIRHVPDDIHRRLKVRATQSGMTLSEFLLREVSAIAHRPTLDEVVDRIRRRRRLAQSVDSAALVRAERETRR